MLVRGIKGARAPFRLLPGLVLHQPEGDFTAETDSILRHGRAIDLG
jgi:tRNA1(Val) A37 N6-methylase TrmN6